MQGLEWATEEAQTLDQAVATNSSPSSLIPCLIHNPRLRFHRVRTIRSGAPCGSIEPLTLIETLEAFEAALALIGPAARLEFEPLHSSEWDLVHQHRNLRFRLKCVRNLIEDCRTLLRG